MARSTSSLGPSRRDYDSTQAEVTHQCSCESKHFLITCEDGASPDHVKGEAKIIHHRALVRSDLAIRLGLLVRKDSRDGGVRHDEEFGLPEGVKISLGVTGI